MKISKLTHLVLFVAVFSNFAGAAIVQVGNLNIIDESGNLSDGLRFLDISHSAGLTSEVALSNAAAVYPNVRLATPSEFDDLFEAGGIVYSGSLVASDGFGTGPGGTLSLLPRPINSLGTILDIGAGTGVTSIWTDPENDATLDVLNLFAGVLTPNIEIGPDDGVFVPEVGWLIVTEIPEPSSLLYSIFGLSLLGLRCRKKV